MFIIRTTRKSILMLSGRAWPRRVQDKQQMFTLTLRVVKIQDVRNDGRYDSMDGRRRIANG